MHHKILTATLIASICSIGVSNITCAANVPVIQPSSMTMNGFYIGGMLGAANLMNKESHAVMPESHQVGSVGAVGGLFAGYDYGLNNWARLAIEGFFEVPDQNINISHASNTYTMTQDYNLGLRLLPEYVFTPSTVGHIILGYVNGRFHINDNGVYGTINTAYHQGGIQTGLGLTTTLQNNLFIRLDALYDAYASATNTGTGLTTPTQSYTNRFSQLAGELGVIYKF